MLLVTDQTNTTENKRIFDKISSTPIRSARNNKWNDGFCTPPALQSRATCPPILKRRYLPQCVIMDAEYLDSLDHASETSNITCPNFRPSKVTKTEGMIWFSIGKSFTQENSASFVPKVLSTSNKSPENQNIFKCSSSPAWSPSPLVRTDSFMLDDENPEGPSEAINCALPTH